MTHTPERNDAPVVFTFESTEVRTIADEKGELWFSATEVCGILGYKNPWDATAKHCRQAGLAKREVSSGGQMREINFINEPNLYRLIIKSRKPEAEKFEAWVMEEVLPAIRKSGYYDARRGMPQLNVAQLLSTQRQVCALMQGLKRETEPALRRTLHAQLEQICRRSPSRCPDWKPSAATPCRTTKARCWKSSGTPTKRCRTSGAENSIMHAVRS